MKSKLLIVIFLIMAGIGYAQTDTIIVTSPVGGELWDVATSQKITWTSTNVTDVKLEYTVNGTSWYTIVNSMPASAGTYSWIIPDSLTSLCKIKLTNISSLKSSTSKAPFTITKLVTTKDINFIPDELAASWPNSPLSGKTVRVRGTVMYRTRVNTITEPMDRKPILTYNKALSSYIQEEDNSAWSGLNIYQLDSNVTGTLFDIVDTASTYEFTGVVTPYGATTELMLTTTPAPVECTLISQQAKRPAPIVLTMDTCYFNGSFNPYLRKFAGMYVKIEARPSSPLITSNLITGATSTAGGFQMDDGLGHKIQMYAQSNYFKTASTYPRLRSDGYTPPPNGSYLSYISGILMAYNSPTDGWIWEVVPVYPSDLGPVLASPPSISTVRRDNGVVAPNAPVTVSASIVGLKGSYVVGAYLFRRVNGVAMDSVAMTRGVLDTNAYTVVIPGVKDSSFVDYYIKAYDNGNLSSTNPQNIKTSRFSYLVLNRDLTIQDVRYSPFGSGYSSYNGYKVKISGVVTADTSDIPGNHGTNPARVYIQNGSTPWAGILIGTGGALASNVGKLLRGDNVTIQGTITLGSMGTKIDTCDIITVNSSGNAMPESHVMKTGDVAMNPIGNLLLEPWSGSLVTYKNITIDQRNADTSATSTTNFGESYCIDADGGIHTRIIWSDGHTSFNAGATAVKVNLGGNNKPDKFSSVTGVLGFTHSVAKLTPRKDDDILGYVNSVGNELKVMPVAYKLNQNYPNPFNPSTTITYDIPKQGFVKVTVYNLLGQQVMTLVNQDQSAGSHYVSFNASSLNSGVYFYSLTAGNFSQVKKMILVK